MKNEILDYEEAPIESDKRRIVTWGIILILWLGILNCMFNGMAGNLRIIIGLISLLLMTVLQSLQHKSGIEVMQLLLLLGAFRGSQFFELEFTFEFTIGRLGAELDIYLWLMAGVHFILYRKEIKEKVRKLMFPSTEVQESIEESKVRSFKRRFSTKDLKELEEIVNENRLIPEAIKAAQQLIIERK